MTSISTAGGFLESAADVPCATADRQGVLDTSCPPVLGHSASSASRVRGTIGHGRRQWEAGSHHGLSRRDLANGPSLFDTARDDAFHDPPIQHEYENRRDGDRNDCGRIDDRVGHDVAAFERGEDDGEGWVDPVLLSTRGKMNCPHPRRNVMIAVAAIPGLAMGSATL